MPPWEPRILPSPGAHKSASSTSEDGHELLADLSGLGALHGQPHVLAVTCDPRTTPDGTVSRMPTLEEIQGAADQLLPGGIFSMTFVACPDGADRPEPQDGPGRVEANQTGEARLSPLVLQ